MEQDALRNEELQLLRQLKATGLHSKHTSTLTVASRLVKKGEAMMWPSEAQGGYFIEITATGAKENDRNS